LALKSEFKQLRKVKVNKKLAKEVDVIIDKFFKYIFN